jgi:hypothetical protein
MKCDIRITTQYRENYGTAEAPHWKMKGSVEFIIRGMDDNDVMYLSRGEVDRIIAEMLVGRSNDMCRYELLDWELIFSEPVELSRITFDSKVKESYDAYFGKE